MLKILVDTSVWLDLAKDYRQQTLLSCLEELIKQEEVELILPRIVLDEFARNRDRIIRESGQSLSSLFRRVKDTVDRFGAEEKKVAALDQLNEIDHRVATLGEAADESIRQIERLFAASAVVETSDGVKVRAADRALQNRAPFHHAKNSIADALLIEIYGEAARADSNEEVSLAFVTHNTKDFSDAAGDVRLPHPDFAPMFPSERSSYSISLAQLLNELAPELVEEIKFELEWSMGPRLLSEILEAVEEHIDKVWYNRHWGLRSDVEAGRVRVVDKFEHKGGLYPRDIVERDIWEGALRSAKRVEEKYGDDLGPWTDFEWGMINGKLSALRWMLGDDWDMLDT